MSSPDLENQHWVGVLGRALRILRTLTLMRVGAASLQVNDKIVVLYVSDSPLRLCSVCDDGLKTIRTVITRFS